MLLQIYYYKLQLYTMAVKCLTNFIVYKINQISACACNYVLTAQHPLLGSTACFTPTSLTSTTPLVTPAHMTSTLQPRMR